MFKLIESKQVGMTHDLAEEFRTMKGSSTERPLNIRRTEHLTEKMQAGLAVPFRWAKARYPNGEEVRVNGQHSSHAVGELNGAFPENMAVTIDVYHVDNDSDAIELFRQFDDRKSGRTPVEVCNAYKNARPGLKGLVTEDLKVVVEGEAWHRRQIEKVYSPDGDDRYKLLNLDEMEDVFIWGSKVLTEGCKEIRSPYITAAMIATYRAEADRARSFWRSVANEAMDTKGEDPAAVLFDWIQAYRNKELKKQPGAKEVYNGCIYAWREDGKDNDISMIRYRLTKKGECLPVVI